MKPRRSLDEHKMMFGYILLLLVCFLTGRIALGHVEEASSFGLTQMITVIAMLAGGFSNWCFNSNDRKEKKDEGEKKE